MAVRAPLIYLVAYCFSILYSLSTSSIIKWGMYFWVTSLAEILCEFEYLRNFQSNISLPYT